MAWFTKLLPKKKINISELEWEKERERKRIAAERAALGFSDSAEEADEDDVCDENGEYPVLERDIFPERIVCPDCGYVTFEGKERCSRCGREL